MRIVDVSIIYVNYNCAKSILKSIKSINEHTRDISYEIIIVDNNSSEELSVLENKNIILIKNEKNYGFAKACNIGAKNSNGKFLLFLNPDTVLLCNCIKVMKDFLEKKKDTAAVGCLTIEGDRNDSPGGARTYHSIFTEIIERSGIAEKFLKNPYYFFWNFNSTKEVDALIGSCIMVKKEIFFRINGFDENFFLYYEDVDLCKRIKNIGFKIYFINTCRLYHKGGESIEKSFKNIEKMTYINLESAYYYFKKHKGNFYSFLWLKIVSIIYFIKYILTGKKFYLNLSKWKPQPYNKVK